MVELPDTRGLICAFQLHENGSSEALSWDLANEPNRTFEKAVWLPFNLADVRVLICESHRANDPAGWRTATR